MTVLELIYPQLGQRF